MGDERDTPRAGRPPDWIRSQSGEEDTDEHTPPPTVVPPEPVDRVKSRRAVATRPPRGSPLDDQVKALRETIDDLWHRDRHHTEANHEVQRALDKLWGLRHVHNNVLELAAQVAHLKEFPADLENELSEVQGTLVLHGNILTDLRGVSGADGKMGELQRAMGRLEKDMQSHSSVLDELRAFKWKAIGVIAAGSVAGGIVASIVTAIIVKYVI